MINKNFGCGSSREHAPQALYRFGIRAVVGESFAAIFAGNCVVIGLPTVAVHERDIAELMQAVESNPQARFTLDLEAKTLTCGTGEVIPINVPDSTRIALLQGSWDSTTMLHANLSKVKKLAANLPYMTGFKS